MSINTILFVIIPFVLMFATSVGMPFYKVSLIKKAGEKLIPLTKKSTLLSYFSAGIAIILMLLSIKVDYGRLNFVLPYCAVLGLFVTIRESTLYPINGVYENLMIVGSDILYYENMVSILSEEESHHPDYVLVIKTKNKGVRQFTFNNANEAAEVKKILEGVCNSK